MSDLNARDNDDSSVRVELGPRSYDVRVTRGESAEFGRFARGCLDATWAGKSCRRALIVTDENVVSHVSPYVDGLARVGIESETEVLTPGEATKRLDSASRLYDALIRMKADRHSCVVAIGGGVIGDLAGFAAATYARGISLLMIPTTLLSQVDSSVGGKVGVNHPGAKNIIGAFHQPSGVWIDVDSLDTLSPREVRCGLAEVVKYGVILDSNFFEYLEGNHIAILEREPVAIRRIIVRSCRLKADVVSRDEREETGLRAVLNFGHTIGHAIEAASGYTDRFRHGEAVAAGMVAECRLAERLGMIDSDVTDRLVSLLERFGLPAAAAGFDPEVLLEAMSRDKKNRGGRVRFVLPTRIGRVELTDAATERDVREILRALV